MSLGESIVSVLDPGVYFVRISPGSTDATGVGYTFGVSASASGSPTTDEPGNTLATATQFGQLNSSIRGFVSTLSDSDDFYQFELDANVDIDISLTGLSGNAQIELIQDLNNNGRLDLNEVLFVSNRGLTLTETISTPLTPGTYFVRVSPGDDNATLAGYTLSINV